MRVVVTGGAGYIGSVVTDQLVRAGHDVTVIDDLSTGHADSLPSSVTLHRMAVGGIAEVLGRGEAVDAVMHFAGKIAAGESVRKPGLYWQSNVVESIELLAAVREARVPRLIFSSSAAVYGNPTHTPITEDAATAPTSPYGWTKLAIDAAIGHECRASDLGAVSLRYFNVAGASRSSDGRPLGERHNPETHLIPLAFEVVAGQRGQLELFGDDYPSPDGTCVRDYIHVEDLARAHLLALEHTHPGEHQVYNLGNGQGHSNREVIEAVQTVTGTKVNVSVAPRREGDPAILVASSERAETQLGWTRQKPDLPAIVADAWEFYGRSS